MQACRNGLHKKGGGRGGGAPASGMKALGSSPSERKAKAGHAGIRVCMFAYFPLVDLHLAQSCTDPTSGTQEPGRATEPEPGETNATDE